MEMMASKVPVAAPPEGREAARSEVEPARRSVAEVVPAAAFWIWEALKRLGMLADEDKEFEC